LPIAHRIGARPGRESPPNLGDYSVTCARFTVNVPERLNPVLDILDVWAAEEPGALALLCLGPRGETVARSSVAEVAELARRGASLLLERGVGKGDAVMLALPRVPAWHAIFLGAIRIGAVPVLVPPAYSGPGLASLAARTDAVAVVADAQTSDALDASAAALPGLRLRHDDAPSDASGWLDLDRLLEQVEEVELPPDPTAAEDPLLLQCTRGFAGAPKVVAHRQSWALGQVASARYWHDLRPGDLHWTLPGAGSTISAWGGLFGQWHERAAVVQADLSAADVAAVAAAVARHEVTSLCAAPAFYERLLADGLDDVDLSRLRHCTSTGTRLSAAVTRAWRRAVNLWIYEGYGQTETTTLVANYRSVALRPGSIGKPLPGWDLALLDGDGQPVAPGTVGEIAVRVGAGGWPPGLFSGYDGDPHRTAAAFDGTWYRTGDCAVADDDGYLWFVERVGRDLAAAPEVTFEAGMRWLLDE
jgi:acetyl-CoA synthetase